ncbi:nitrogen fixation protein NifZ [Telmatospirillum sp.]|uniref:nitrogen fixation protein NifZ n=1 Tax=Telmatospirillum sp. TaxID=2079197 RepID=UPI00284006F9|nr:nitrogen fixation protein NifZ [Telmatospirillum sp.]MDR3436167.1 nitrogen fixation protein NifZ [Telmatospirillum sp.]
MRKEMIVEINDPPVYALGQKVRAKKGVRNDGTFPGYNIGDHLISEGDIGYINNIGTFLQQFYIYGVDFVDRGRMVGMRAKELELVED